MWRMTVLAAVLATVASTGTGTAEEELKTYELEEVVVTGSKLPTTPGNVTQKIEVITPAEMEARVLGTGNLAEVLSYSPGNFANALSRNDANWGSSGGLAHTFKGYMLDGLPIDGFVDLQSLDTWAFERVEDQRGSASVLYPTYLGNDFGGNQSPLVGTANFILKERVRQPRTMASMYYGSYNTVGTRFFHQRAAGNLHLFFGGHNEDSDYTDYGTKGSWLNMLKDPEYEKTKLYLRGTYYLPGTPGHRASLYLHRTWHNGDTGRPNRDFGHIYTTLNAKYVLPIQDDLTARLAMGYRDYDRTWEDDNFARDDNGDVIPASLALAAENGVEQEIIPVDLSVSYQHGGGGLLTVGADYQSASYQTWSEVSQKTTGNDAESTQYGVYVQEEQVLDKLVLRAGGRFNHVGQDINQFGGLVLADDSPSWNKFLWSAGTRYNHSDDLSLFANVGSSFKAPAIQSLGGSIAMADSGDANVSGRLPNPDLDPESGVSIDVGGNYSPMENLQVGLRGFVVSVDDQIIQRALADGAQAQDINAGNTSTLGLEAEVRHRHSDMVEWFANYTFTDTEIDNPEDGDKDGAEVNFVPKNVVNLGTNLSLPQAVTVNLTVQVFSSINQDISKSNPNEIDGYHLVNARIEKLFRSKDGHDVKLYVEPYNLTNQDFEMPWGFQDPGFSANGGISVVF